MSTGSINLLSNSYLQSILGSALSASSTTGKTSHSPSGINASAVVQADNSQLSPFAQLMSMLQQLQQSDPAKYQQVTQQIAANLKTAAQTATSEGNTAAASQLTQLSNDFTSASQSGQLPNVQDLAQAAGAHHHHHHHHSAPASSDSSNSTTGASSTGASSTGASQMLSQLLADLQGSSSQSDALNPTSIIFNTLSSAGITAS
jgi:hypothetical protein